MRWKCGCAYDGTDYFGWQTQEGQLSVQQVIEEALEQVFKERVSISGSGRTDAGVHAIEQVFHFDYDWNHAPGKLLAAMHSLLPDSIKPLYIEQVGDDFHARFSAVSKKYQYRLFLGEAEPIDTRYCWSVQENINLNRMAEAIALLEGEHDFAAFAANRGVEYESTTRTMTRADMTQDDRFVYLNFQANGFLYKMARSLAGALVNIGCGRIEPNEIIQLLETAKRTPMVLVAPAQGLFLEKVLY